MKKNKKAYPESSYLSKLSMASELPIDTALGMPLIKLASNREIFVERAGLLEYYDDNCVKLTQGKMNICVMGRALRLKCLADGNISVCGYIMNVGFEAKGGGK